MNHTIIKLIAIALLCSVTINAQIKNTKTETVKINGNCAMCESIIENAGNMKNIAAVDWNKDSKSATLTYDANKTSKEEILKRIALAGYDNEEFLAPEDVYANLPGCCQYEREKKTSDSHAGHSHHEKSGKSEMHIMENKGQLQPVFENYFNIKNALVKSDSKSASGNAKTLVAAIENVKMSELSHEEHNVWMAVMKELVSDAKNIAESNDIDKQRTSFKSLSENMRKLAKVSKQGYAVYVQHCPMVNADWISKENTVKNPYYGSQMLSCGKTIETIE